MDSVLPRTLADLLGKTSEEVFFAEYYCRRFLYQSGAFAAEHQLLAVEDVERHLRATAYPSSTILLLQDGQRRLAQTRNEVLNAFRAGSTFIVQEADLAFVALAELVGSMERSFGETLAANLYVSAAAKPGFSRHFDTHDVLVLQLHGSKRWRLYDRTTEMPLWDQHEHDRIPPGDDTLLAELHLQPGDVLYLPRGYWHEPLATHDSVHLTVGIHQATPTDLLHWLTGDITDDPALRVAFGRTAPGGSYLDRDRLPTDLVAHWTGIGDRIAARLHEPETINRFLRARAGTPTRRALPRLAQDRFRREVAAHRPAQVRLAPWAVPWVEREPDGVLVYAVDKRFRLPAAAAPGLDLLLTGEPVGAEDLEAAGLDAGTAARLLDTFYAAGLLEET